MFKVFIVFWEETFFFYYYLFRLLLLLLLLSSSSLKADVCFGVLKEKYLQWTISDKTVELSHGVAYRVCPEPLTLTLDPWILALYPLTPLKWGFRPWPCMVLTVPLVHLCWPPLLIFNCISLMLMTTRKQGQILYLIKSAKQDPIRHGALFVTIVLFCCPQPHTVNKF